MVIMTATWPMLMRTYDDATAGNIPQTQSAPHRLPIRMPLLWDGKKVLRNLAEGSPSTPSIAPFAVYPFVASPRGCRRKVMLATRLKKIVGAPSRSGGTSHYRGLDLEDDPLYKEWMTNGFGLSRDGRGFHRCECKTCKEAAAEAQNPRWV